MRGRFVKGVQVDFILSVKREILDQVQDDGALGSRSMECFG